MVTIRDGIPMLWRYLRVARSFILLNSLAPCTPAWQSSKRSIQSNPSTSQWVRCRSSPRDPSSHEPLFKMPASVDVAGIELNPLHRDSGHRSWYDDLTGHLFGHLTGGLNLFCKSSYRRAGARSMCDIQFHSSISCVRRFSAEFSRMLPHREYGAIGWWKRPTSPNSMRFSQTEKLSSGTTRNCPPDLRWTERRTPFLGTPVSDRSRIGDLRFSTSATEATDISKLKGSCLSLSRPPFLEQEHKISTCCVAPIKIRCWFFPG